MADKISANITYVDANNNKGSKAITDIGPNADNGSIKNFCVGFLGLTTNTLAQIDRVEKTDITNATTKPKLSLTLSSETTNARTNESDTSGELFVETITTNYTYKVTAFQNAAGKFAVNFYKTDENKLHFETVVSYEAGGSTTYQIYFEETETTAATTAQIVFSTSAPVLTIL